MRFTVYRTDKGSLDKGGLPQPSYLNFDAKLLYPPPHALQVRRAWLNPASCEHYKVCEPYCQAPRTVPQCVAQIRGAGSPACPA